MAQADSPILVFSDHVKGQPVSVVPPALLLSGFFQVGRAPKEVLCPLGMSYSNLPHITS